MSARGSTVGAHGGHGHRSWLHLLPEESEFVPSPHQVEETERLLVETGMALPGVEPHEFIPGPSFGRLLVPRSLPMAGPQRGEVRFESGVLRCYPDPGPQGFDTDPPRRYLTACPLCEAELEFFRLRFPNPDPMQAACPNCARGVDVSLLSWSPVLPVARTELTFGDLEDRPSLRNSDLLAQLETIWGMAVAEAHVTL